MKLILSVKMLLLLGLYITVYSPVNAQLITVDIVKLPYQGQQTGNWCWAASMKMIMDYHEPDSAANFTQCDLVKELSRLSTSASRHPGINNADCCHTCTYGCPDTLGLPPCSDIEQLRLANRRLEYTSDLSAIPAVADNYDLVFAQWGYSSIQQVNRKNEPVKWDHVKKQIEECRPFIINVGDLPSGSELENQNHALVVKAYREDTTLNLRMIMAYDPWRPCCDTINEALFPFDIFTQDTSTDSFSLDIVFINNVQSTVHTIQSGTIFEDVDETVCESCEVLISTHGGQNVKVTTPPPPTTFRSGEEGGPQKKLMANTFDPPVGNTTIEDRPSRLFAILDKHQERVLGYPKTKYSEEDNFSGVLEEPGYFYAPVEFISSRLINRPHFLACLFPPKKLHRVSIPNVEVVEVLNNNVEETVATTFQKSAKGDWMMRKMTTYSYLENDILIRLENQDGSLELNNKQTISDAEQKTKFTIVKFFPYQYEFFSFTQNGREYMAPAANYPDLGLDERVGYKSPKVLRKLRRETRPFEKEIQSLFPNASDYKDYIRILQAFLPTEKPIFVGPNKLVPGQEGQFNNQEEK